MSVSDIVSLMTPPQMPNEAPMNGEWPESEAKLGTSLPTDYKEFINLFGTGKIDNFLWIFNPFSQNENLNLEAQLHTQLTALSELQTYGEILPYRLFPEQDGIFPFASTENGDILFWQTKGMPDEWTVVVNEARSPEWEMFAMTMSEFLLKTLKRQIHPKAFPSAFPSSSTFTPGH